MKKKLFPLLSLVLAMSLLLCACASNQTAQGNGNDGNSGTVGGDAASTDTDTVAVGAVVIARDDIPEEQVYAFVSSIFEYTDAIAAQHGKGEELDLDFAASVASVPYHPGAAKYFGEKGILWM